MLLRYEVLVTEMQLESSLCRLDLDSYVKLAKASKILYCIAIAASVALGREFRMLLFQHFHHSLQIDTVDSSYVAQKVTFLHPCLFSINPCRHTIYHISPSHPNLHKYQNIQYTPSYPIITITTSIPSHPINLPPSSPPLDSTSSPQTQ